MKDYYQCNLGAGSRALGLKALAVVPFRADMSSSFANTKILELRLRFGYSYVDFKSYRSLGHSLEDQVT